VLHPVFNHIYTYTHIRARTYMRNFSNTNTSTLGWDVLTFFPATLAISLASVIDVRRHEVARRGGERMLYTCTRRRTELKNIHMETSRCGGSTLASKRIYAIRYPNENIARQNSDDPGGMLPTNTPKIPLWHYGAGP